jgi:hypothetical protein
MIGGCSPSRISPLSLTSPLLRCGMERPPLTSDAVPLTHAESSDAK